VTGGDVVRACLAIAAEDDAVKTRTHIPLPTAARLDNLAGVSPAQPSPAQPSYAAADLAATLWEFDS
jgi:hypothetical protein